KISKSSSETRLRSDRSKPAVHTASASAPALPAGPSEMDMLLKVRKVRARLDSWEAGMGAEKESVEREMRRVVRRVPVGKCMVAGEVEGEVEIKLELEIVVVEEAL